MHQRKGLLYNNYMAREELARFLKRHILKNSVLLSFLLMRKDDTSVQSFDWYLENVYPQLQIPRNTMVKTIFIAVLHAQQLYLQSF
jgi:hypothetical protein